MAIIIGRAGSDTGLALPSPTTVNRDGDRVSLRGNLWSDTSIALGRVLRDQVIGLDPSNSPGMPARPVIYAPGDISRFGRVLSASCPSSRAAEATGVWPYDIDIEWVTSSHAPLVEERLIGAERTQPDGTAEPHGVTPSYSHWAGVGVYNHAIGAAATIGSRTGADGAVAGTVDTDAQSPTATWYVAPADFYKGACNVAQIVGATSYSIVGREMPNIPTTWAMGNSLVNVIGSATAAKAEFAMLWHDGTQYESTKVLRVAAAGSDLTFAPVQVRTLRNTPEQCSIRVRLGYAGTTGAVDLDTTYVDITLRRGHRFAEFLITSTASATWGLNLVTAEALTAITGGARATNNDAGGNKLVFASPQAHTLDTTNGKIRLTSAGLKFAAGVGISIGGSLVAPPDETPQAVANQYFAAQYGTQRVVIP